METDKVNEDEMKIEKENLLLRDCKSVREMKIEKVRVIWKLIKWLKMKRIGSRQ